MKAKLSILHFVVQLSSNFTEFRSAILEELSVALSSAEQPPPELPVGGKEGAREEDGQWMPQPERLRATASGCPPIPMGG